MGVQTFEEIWNSIKLEPNFNLMLSALGQAGEVGEYANLIKKQYRDGLEQHQKKREELADIVIYAILNAKHDLIDLVDAIYEKLLLNESKRPEKKFEYTIEGSLMTWDYSDDHFVYDADLGWCHTNGIPNVTYTPYHKEDECDRSCRKRGIKK